MGNVDRSEFPLGVYLTRAYRVAILDGFAAKVFYKFRAGCLPAGKALYFLDFLEAAVAK